tara:strand:+ start:3646 stop:3837 length:192 start_codon:yes stop_codon:yes gene_type:complete
MYRITQSIKKIPFTPFSNFIQIIISDQINSKIEENKHKITGGICPACDAMELRRRRIDGWERE